MRKFLRGLRNVITFPFHAIVWVISRPVLIVRSIRTFLTTEPEEHPLADVVVELVQNNQAREVFWNQIEIFRAHLLRAMIAIAIGVGIALFYTPTLVAFLAVPIGGLKTLKAIEVTESISVYMKVSLLAGVSIALPYVVFELWLFIAPGLRIRERLYALVGIPLAALFFVAGMAFTYFIMLPSALPFLLGILGIQAQLRPESYFSFVTGLMFWIGAAFEFPLVIYLLTAIGLIKPQPLARNWRIAVLVIAIISAAITPTVDPLNMSLVMLPMIGLYFISIGLSYFAYRERNNPADQAKVKEGTI
jgi:sec-independent protein translocase protein TatC